MKSRPESKEDISSAKRKPKLIAYPSEDPEDYDEVSENRNRDTNIEPSIVDPAPRRRIAIPPGGSLKVGRRENREEDIHFGPDSVYREPGVRIFENIKRSDFSPNNIINQLQQELLDTFNESNEKKSALNEPIRATFRSLNIRVDNSDFFEYSILHAAGCFPLTNSLKNAITLKFDYSNPIALQIFVNVTNGSLQDDLNKLIEKAKLTSLKKSIFPDRRTHQLKLSYEYAIGHLITNPIFIARALIGKKEELEKEPEFKNACSLLLNDLQQFASLKKCVPRDVVDPLICTLKKYTPSASLVSRSGMFSAAVFTVAAVTAISGMVAVVNRGLR
jgi:hypothetical protein